MGAYDLLLQDIRSSIARSDPAFAAALQGTSSPRSSQPSPRSNADLGGILRQARRSTEQMTKALAAITPTRDQLLAEARAGVQEVLAKAMSDFEGGRLSGHEVRVLEIQADAMLERYVAGLGR